MQATESARRRIRPGIGLRRPKGNLALRSSRVKIPMALSFAPDDSGVPRLAAPNTRRAAKHLHPVFVFLALAVFSQTGAGSSNQTIALFPSASSQTGRDLPESSTIPRSRGRPRLWRSTTQEMSTDR